MTAARVFTPPNRLAKIVESREGVCFDTLVEAAEQRLDGLKDDLAGYVRGQVQTIAGLATLGEEIMFARCAEIGEAAMNVADVAAVAGLSDLGEAAGGIRAMIDSLYCKGVWHTDALEAHITSLLLLNSDPPPPPDAAAKILTRLSRMRAAIGVVE